MIPIPLPEVLHTYQYSCNIISYLEVLLDTSDLSVICSTVENTNNATDLSGGKIWRAQASWPLVCSAVALGPYGLAMLSEFQMGLQSPPLCQKWQ